VPKVNDSYREMQSAAWQLREGGQLIEADLQRLKHLVDSVIASGYLADASSRQFGQIGHVGFVGRRA
jgi:hypothetical protein